MNPHDVTRPDRIWDLNTLTGDSPLVHSLHVDPEREIAWMTGLSCRRASGAVHPGRRIVIRVSLADDTATVYDAPEGDPHLALAPDDTGGVYVYVPSRSRLARFDTEFRETHRFPEPLPNLVGLIALPGGDVITLTHPPLVPTGTYPACHTLTRHAPDGQVRWRTPLLSPTAQTYLVNLAGTPAVVAGLNHVSVAVFAPENGRIRSIEKTSAVCVNEWLVTAPLLIDAPFPTVIQTFTGAYGGADPQAVLIATHGPTGNVLLRHTLGRASRPLPGIPPDCRLFSTTPDAVYAYEQRPTDDICRLLRLWPPHPRQGDNGGTPTR